MTPKRRAQLTEAKRRQRERARSAGLCIICVQRKPPKRRVTCVECSQRRTAARHRAQSSAGST
jgi:hypothetical protein